MYVTILIATCADKNKTWSENELKLTCKSIPIASNNDLQRQLMMDVKVTSIRLME